MNLRIHRLAVAEIDHEVDYYESRQAGLGTELEDAIHAAFSLILRFPEAAPQWRDRHESFGALITSTQPIAVERALYASTGGVFWGAGTNATATRVP